jgi:hypothetical protein
MEKSMNELNLSAIPENIRKPLVAILGPVGAEFYVEDKFYMAEDYPEFYPLISWMLWNGFRFGEEVRINMYD